MSCCAPGLEVALEIGLARPFYDREIVLASRDIGKRLGCRDRVTPQLKRDAEVATWNSAGGRAQGCIEIMARLRPSASEAVGGMRRPEQSAAILSGDDTNVVAEAASSVEIDQATGGILTHDKVARLEFLASHGCEVIVVGDGLNDAPAREAADISMAPSAAAHRERGSADLVFLDYSVENMPEVIMVGRMATRRGTQNIRLSFAHDELALAGYVTILVGAVAMLISSILVVANAPHRAGQSGAPSRGRTAWKSLRLSEAT